MMEAFDGTQSSEEFIKLILETMVKHATPTVPIVIRDTEESGKVFTLAVTCLEFAAIAEQVDKQLDPKALN